MWRDQIRGARRRKRRPAFSCSSCGRRYSNPLTHNCKGGGDFAGRRRAQDRTAAAAKRRADRAAARKQERERIAAVRQAERAKARTRVAAARKSEREKARARAARKRPAGRPRADRHDYQSCRDRECDRLACRAWREGFDEGVAACPRPHTAAS